MDGQPSSDMGQIRSEHTFAKFRGKSTSTPFIIAKSAFVRRKSVWVRPGKQVVATLTVREQLKRDNVDQALKTINSRGNSDSPDSRINRRIVLVTDDN